MGEMITTESGIQFDKDKLIADLKAGIVVVSFKKVSTGELRVMPCTLSEKIIPKQNYVKNEKIVPANQAQRVWVTDIDAWRAFRFDTITSYYTVETE